MVGRTKSSGRSSGDYQVSLALDGTWDRGLKPSPLSRALCFCEGEGERERERETGADIAEFKFWYSATKATGTALLCTLTRATDVPVYWPILLIYFLTLFGLTMRRQIQYVVPDCYSLDAADKSDI